ncbi:MAG: preprotein translocase subunit SecY [Janthinobacterium lividum]
MAVKRPGTNIPPASPFGGGGRRVTAGPRSGSNAPFIEAMVAAWAIPELRRRLMFIFWMFAVYVVGLHIPLPGINTNALASLFKSGGILSLVDVFSGGALKRFTVFAMGIVPYINASIIMQLLTFAIPSWQELAKEGESGRKRIAQYTRYLTMALALAQSIGFVLYLRHGGALSSNLFLNTEVILTMMAGTAFLMWLGEQITDKGIGNGISLIIFCGIMVRLPGQLIATGREIIAGTVQPWQALILVVAFFVTVIGVVFVTLGQRKVPIQHVRKIVGNKMSQGGTSYLPFRIAQAGVIPIIFALSIQLLPATFATFVPQTSSLGVFLAKATIAMRPGTSPIAALIYAVIIVFFTYFYTSVTMNIEQMADDLKKYGSFIPGIRPGKATVDYLDKVMTRITLAGALFLALIALLNYWIPELTGTVSTFTLIGGTSLLIVVSVALDTMQAIEAQLLMRNYEGFIR